MADYWYYEDFYVMVNVETHDYVGRPRVHKDMLADAQSLERQIKRHVDDFSDISVRFTRYLLCEYCNRDPERQPPLGEPLCCDKAYWEWMGEIADFY